MHKFVFFCKSYEGDIELVKTMVTSYLRFNKDKIPLYISVPQKDFKLFSDQFHHAQIALLKDEEIADGLVDNTDKWFSPGYINQEIVKLSFWKTSLAENYFCIDSDSYFIRDFYYLDFMYDADTPYTVLVEDKELCVDPLYYNLFWKSRISSLNEIKKRIGLEDRRFLTCHNNTTLSAKVLRSFEREYLQPNNLSYLDILKIAPFEYSWYNFWLQKRQVVPIIAVEPFFKMFHLKEHYIDYCKKKITESDIARAYVGICINSNWAKKEGLLGSYHCEKRLLDFSNITKSFYKIRKRMLK